MISLNTKNTGKFDLSRELFVQEAEDGPAAQVHDDVQPRLCHTFSWYVDGYDAQEFL